MRAVLQRLGRASVGIKGETTASVDGGLLVLLGVSKDDGEEQAQLLAAKSANLRIFEDEAGKLGKSLLDLGAPVLVVSNFTLYADCKHGRRPDFAGAASFAQAERLYEFFCARLKAEGVSEVQTGVFGADMTVELINDGPVTVILDTDCL